MIRSFVLLIGIILISLVGCEKKTSSDGPYQIAATTGMIADIVRQVAGPHARVEGIMRAGVDPHLYQPTRNDVLRLREANVVFYNGLLLEGKMSEILDKIEEPGKPVVAVTQALADDPSYVLMDESQHADPHVWMDVRGWIHAVGAVRETLSAHDPKNATAYAAQAEAYIKELNALEKYAQETIATIPAGQRVLITAHDAFGYFGRAYDIEVRGIQGISTQSEAGLKDINSLIDFIVERRIPAVFVETSVADRNVRALVEGARQRGHGVVVGGTLFSDAMGEAGTYEGTYIGMIDHNVTTIVRALGGSAPAGGLRGTLVGEPSAAESDS